MSNPTSPEPVVWIIDNEHWPRVCLRAELIERGVDAIGFEQFEEAFQMLQNPFVRRPKLGVLELKNQDLNSEHLELWRKNQIPLIILAAARELSLALLQELNPAHILRRPISIGQIANTVMHELAKLQEK